ncbi:OsmC family peroxiredoxin [Rarobacter faecitabidus]|uniref:Osmotically inducible protein OsmC n=1 Tax=Rarobacter faecitabidus TaxID=13243 RepID=A0A542ZUV9_RARFA|nr:OsmC family peroxiredoxin [Rarobacter faecitabidus]TQL64137.1 osmotically inducible protein OsmC [Rarobacter faecitabidus]
MVNSKASVTWNGALSDGHGEVRLDSSGAATLPVNWRARSQGSDSVTTPEELLGAAHAACFAMALSHALEGNGTPPTQLDVTASVGFTPGVGITGSHLTLRAQIPGLDEASFERFVDEAKEGCPVSVALSGIEITLDATLA